MTNDETKWLARAWAWLNAHSETAIPAVFSVAVFVYIGMDRGAGVAILLLLAFYAFVTIVVNGLIAYPLFHALFTLRPSVLRRRARQMSRGQWVYLVVSTGLLAVLLLVVLPPTVAAAVAGGSVPLLLVLYVLDLVGLFPLRGD